MSQPATVAGKDLVGPLPLGDEQWREYEWTDPTSGNRVTYRINKPAALYYRTGGTTHRVVDSEGVAHVTPAPGQMGSVLRWFAPETPVSF